MEIHYRGLQFSEEYFELLLVHQLYITHYTGQSFAQSSHVQMFKTFLPSPETKQTVQLNLNC